MPKVRFFRKSISGSAALRRRGWTPSVIGGSLHVWVDASRLDTVFASGSPLRVSQWSDISGNGRHLTQGTGSVQPYWQPTGFNSKPTIEFRQPDNTRLRNTFGPLPQPFTICVAYRTAASIVATGMVVSSANINDPSANNTQTTVNFLTSPQRVQMFAGLGGNAAQGDLAVNTAYFGVFGFNGASSQYSVNGTNSVINPSTKGLSGIELGTWNNGSNAQNVFLSEVVLVNRMLTAKERQSMEGYLAWKWGMQLSLPVNHPSYLAPPNSSE
jgi:hypothetical protein